MTYFLHQKPEDYCPIEERERKVDDILTAAQDDKELFDQIDEEVWVRRSEKLTQLHYEAFIGMDIRKNLDKLIEEVVEECLTKDINYFGE